MPTKRKMLKCRSCGEKQEHLINTPSHLLHLVLTILTAGLWAVIWLLLALSTGTPECAKCGKKRLLFGLIYI